MMKTFSYALLIIALAGPALADTLHLTSGNTIEGTVTQYASGVFEVDTKEGATSRQPAAMIKKIEFTPRPVTLPVRGRDDVNGQILGYEGGMFLVQTGNGNTEKLSAMFVANASFGGGSSKKFLVIPGGGRVELSKLIVPGKVTVVDFYADWCGPCRSIAPTLQKLAENDPAVYVRKVDIVKWGTPVTKQYGINSIPRVDVFGTDGKLVGTVRGANPKAINDLVAKAKKD